MIENWRPPVPASGFCRCQSRSRQVPVEEGRALSGHLAGVGKCQPGNLPACPSQDDLAVQPYAAGLLQGRGSCQVCGPGPGEPQYRFQGLATDKLQARQSEHLWRRASPLCLHLIWYSAGRMQSCPHAPTCPLCCHKC